MLLQDAFEDTDEAENFLHTREFIFNVDRNFTPGETNITVSLPHPDYEPDDDEANAVKYLIVFGNYIYRE